MKRMAHLSSGSKFSPTDHPFTTRGGSGLAGGGKCSRSKLGHEKGMNIIPGRLAQPLKEKETAVRKECSDILIILISAGV